MKVFPGDAPAFNLGHSYSALQSLTAIFSASHFASSARLGSLARISVLFISERGLCFLLLLIGRYITPPLPLTTFGGCAASLAFVQHGWPGMKGDSPSPSWGQDEMHPAERGNEDEVGKKIWVVRLLSPLPLSTFHSASPPLSSSSSSRP